MNYYFLWFTCLEPGLSRFILLKNVQNWVKKSGKLTSLKGYFIIRLKKKWLQSEFMSQIALLLKRRKSGLSWVMENFETIFRFAEPSDYRFAQPPTDEELKMIVEDLLFPCSLKKSESVSTTWEIAPEPIYISKWSLFWVTAKPTH